MPSRPYFVLDGNICALQAAKDHVNVFLYDGAIVPDPEGIITGGHDNKTARTVAIRNGQTINAPAHCRGPADHRRQPGRRLAQAQARNLSRPSGPAPAAPRRRTDPPDMSPPMPNTGNRQYRSDRRVGARLLAVGGASQQSRYGLLDGHLFCICIHRHPWGEYPHLPRTGSRAVPPREHGARRRSGRVHTLQL